MLSALLGEEGDGNSILDAARGLMGAFSDLLKCAQPESQEVKISSIFQIIFFKIGCSLLLNNLR